MGRLVGGGGHVEVAVVTENGLTSRTAPQFNGSLYFRTGVLVAAIAVKFAAGCGKEW